MHGRVSPFRIPGLEELWGPYDLSSCRTRIFRENFTSTEHISSPSTLLSSVPLFLFNSVVYLLEEWRECMKLCCWICCIRKTGLLHHSDQLILLAVEWTETASRAGSKSSLSWSVQYPCQAHSRHVTNANSSQLATLSRHCCFVVCVLFLSRSQQA